MKTKYSTATLWLLSATFFFSLQTQASFSGISCSYPTNSTTLGLIQFRSPTKMDLTHPNAPQLELRVNKAKENTTFFVETTTQDSIETVSYKYQNPFYLSEIELLIHNTPDNSTPTVEGTWKTETSGLRPLTCQWLLETKENFVEIL